MKTEWDMIVVGAGPAGLAVARHVIRERPNSRILLLEKSPKVGGRTRTLTFAGKTELPCGAGVGRTHKDTRLAAWLTEMGFEKQTWVSRPTTVFLEKDNQNQKHLTPFSLQTLVKRLENAVRPSDTRRTFREFSQEVLSPAEWEWFQSAMGYTDYLEADAWETVKYYGFDDNDAPLHGFTVPWTALAETTRNTLKSAGVVFRFGAEVSTVSLLNNNNNNNNNNISHAVVKWNTQKGSYEATAKAVVVATAVQGLRKLFPNARAYRRDALEGQPFIRLYAALNAYGRAFMEANAHRLWKEGMAIVPGSLQKVSVIDQAKGIYRLAYADNARAKALRRQLHGKTPEQTLTKELRKVFARVALSADAQESSYISKWKACYWFPTGTHYYPPLPQWAKHREAYVYEAQHPMTPAAPIWVVGEAVSRDQGWTEGALASVEAVLPEILQKLF
jgi:monoamine oxidase